MMAGTAIYGTMAGKIARFGRRECYFARFAGLDLDVDVKILNSKPMSNIETLQYQHNRLTHLHGNLTGFENKTLRSDLNPLRRVLCSARRGKRSSSGHADKHNKQ